MMTTLVYIPSGLQSPELEIMLCKAQTSIDRGEHTTVVTCSGGEGYACSLNIYGLRLICNSCRFQALQGLARLSGNYCHIETPKSIHGRIPEKKRISILKNRWSLKRYSFEGCDIGQAAYSSYISSSRDQDLEGRLSRWSLNQLICTSEALVVWFRQIIKVYKVDKVVLYNGRQNQCRPLLRLAQAEHLGLEVMEFSGQHAGCVYTFHNNLPQDLSLLNDCIETCWQNFKGNVKQIADEYYSHKRSGGVVNDSKAYVLGQEVGLLPEGWDSSKHNIGIFNSSEDEFAALGGEYDETLYANQSEAITRLCEAVSGDPEIVLWLRVHPNLHGVGWSFARQLNKLETKFCNFHVIAGDSPVSSYSLLDACRTVLSFGSTMGVEAVYWGKPSVLLGRCVYEKLGCVYIPKNHAEVVRQIKNRDLKPLPLEGAYKVALFWSQGGTNLYGLTGNRASGFNFLGHSFKRPFIQNLSFSLGKFIEKAVLGHLVNFVMRRAPMLSEHQ
ncbi:hypothetical protein G6704_01630 [Polynucleobacter paneuropaeus]|nr:hypothetical protein G6704_01630 [Polynucleobacter paneuropaeus]